jgi:hypothetical protein
MRGWESPHIPAIDKKHKVTKRARKAIKEVQALKLDKVNSDLLNEDLAQFVRLQEQKKTAENKQLLMYLMGQLALRILEMYEEEALLLLELEDD